MPATLYEILSREIQTKRKLAAVTLRELEPVTHNVLRTSVVLPVGTLLRESRGATWKVREVVANTLLLEGAPGRLPRGEYLEGIVL